MRAGRNITFMQTLSKSLKCNKNNIGLYRDDGLAIFKKINGFKIRKS